MRAGPRLQTERLLLRRWTSADLEPFAAINADPEVTRLLRGPMDRARSDTFVERIEHSNERSQAVMRRLGMTRKPSDDFEQAGFPVGHPLRTAVLHRVTRPAWSTQKG